MESRSASAATPGESFVLSPDGGAWATRHRRDMTLVWFIVWLIANNVGGHEPLLLDPVNAWTATLIVAVALDLSAGHAVRGAAR